MRQIVVDENQESPQLTLAGILFNAKNIDGCIAELKKVRSLQNGYLTVSNWISDKINFETGGVSEAIKFLPLMSGEKKGMAYTTLTDRLMKGKETEYLFKWIMKYDDLDHINGTYESLLEYFVAKDKADMATEFAQRVQEMRGPKPR